MNEIWLLIKYIVLGLVQGFTEPIPISSSGHLVIIRELFGLEIEGLSFEILVNFGSLIAVCIVYYKDIIRLIKHNIKFIITREIKYKSDFFFVVYLIVATFITGILGLVLKDYIEAHLSVPIIVGVTLLITGFFLWIIRNLQGNKFDGDITLKDAIIVGFAQSIALIPGISRSGATIVAAMLLGMKQETALRFSFLLYIPVSLGITVLSIDDIIADPLFSTYFVPHILAFLASIIATYFALKWFMNVMARGNLIYFAIYCFIVGGLVTLYYAYQFVF